jgi:nucleotide-binding universal stress UspA family protein
MNRLLVAFDGTPDDHGLADWAADFVDDVGVHIVASHFIPRATVWMIAGAQVNSAEYIDELRQHFERDVLPALRDRDPLLHLHIQIGDPAREIAALARSCSADLIAIAGHNHSALRDAVFGGIEHQLTHLSTVPVVVVPARASYFHSAH